MGFANRRAVSTTESHARNLPPITDKPRPGNRKVGLRNAKQEKQLCWARSWAGARAEQTNVHAKGCTVCTTHNRRNHLSPLKNTGFKSAHKSNEVIAMNEKEAMVFRRLKGIYANSTERSLRAQRLQDNINSLQSRTLHSEIDCSLKEFKKKQEEDKRNRSELKRVRDRFSKDRERRRKCSYVSVNALECPQVSRQAYGLPEDGHEYRHSGVTQHAQQKLRDIWKNAMKRAAIVDKMINVRTKEKESLPEIKVRRQSIAQKETRTPSPRKEGIPSFHYRALHLPSFLLPPHMTLSILLILAGQYAGRMSYINLVVYSLARHEMAENYQKKSCEGSIQNLSSSNSTACIQVVCFTS